MNFDNNDKNNIEHENKTTLKLTKNDRTGLVIDSKIKENITSLQVNNNKINSINIIRKKSNT